MSEKVTVNPESVRGLGDIVKKKLLSEYNPCCCSLSEGTGVIGDESLPVINVTGTNGSRFTDLNFNPVYSSSPAAISCKLKDYSGNVITGASISCIVNNGTPLTSTTDSSGAVSFSITLAEQGLYNVKLIYPGSSGVTGCSHGFRFYYGSVTGLTVLGDINPVDHDENSHLLATLTDSGGAGIPGVPVSFYETYTPTRLTISGSESIMTHEQEAVVTVLLRDADNSRIQGETVNIYDNSDILVTIPFYSYQSPNNATRYDTVNGTDYNLTLPDDFELSFELQSTITDARFILSNNEDTATSRQYGIMVTISNSTFWYGTRTTVNDETETSITNDEQVHKIRIIRHDDSLDYYIDNTLVGNKTADWLDNYTYTFYFVLWGRGTISVKNLRFKEI